VSWDLAGGVVGGVLGLAAAPLASILAERSPLRAETAEAFGLRSRCSTCRNPVAGIDAVPLVSFVRSRRCRSCGAAIPAAEPLVEMATVAAGAITGARVAGFGEPWAAVVALVIWALVLVPMSVFDLRTRSIATRLVYPAALVVAALLAVAALVDGDAGRALRVVGSGVAASAFIWMLFFISPGGMGDGDARLALLLGIGLGWFGWMHTAVGVFLGFVIGAVVGVAYAVVSRKGMKAAIPFGPWLAAGAWVAVLLADRIAGATV
jgi:leader peptidase (prepilin peptidase)/N-methyltransferase